VLATGDELLEPSQPLEPARIYDSNSYSVAALVRRYGGVPQVLGIAQDNLDSLNAKLDLGLASDMLITTAGVSKGDYDIVKDVLAERGEIAFWSVRMRPAKPLAFGVMRGGGGRSVPHLGLPGNPVSAMVAFEELVRPALLKMMGRTNLDKPIMEAVLEDPIINGDGRRVYARAVITKRDGTYYARLTGAQGSNVLTSMARANGLAICPEDVPVMEKGQRVQVRMLDWDEDGVY
jgi:molybdopterin molybdotransferase